MMIDPERLDEGALARMVDEVLASHDPGQTRPEDFLGARFDAGLAWLDFPPGHGGLGASRRWQPFVERRFRDVGAPSPMRNFIGVGMAGPTIAAEGVTNPPIDELLTKTDSKYKLVLYSAKRARQINAYYSQLGEGLLEYVGPLVDTHVQEKPLSIALREINEDLLTCEDVDPAELAAEEAAASAAAADAGNSFSE